MEYIEAKDVVFSYEEQEGESEKIVIDDVSLHVKKGEFVALLGHNGSGKSTMAKHFNAMLLPSGGKVYVDGMDTVSYTHLDVYKRQAWDFVLSLISVDGAFC